MTEEMKNKLQTTQRRIVDDHTAEEKSGTCPAATHAASVDDIADGEPHPDSEPENDTTEPSRQDPQRARRKQP